LNQLPDIICLSFMWGKNFKTWELVCLISFDLNRGAKQAHNTRGVTYDFVATVGFDLAYDANCKLMHEVAV
jgi:hypothetical protein